MKEVENEGGVRNLVFLVAAPKPQSGFEHSRSTMRPHAVDPEQSPSSGSRPTTRCSTCRSSSASRKGCSQGGRPRCQLLGDPRGPREGQRRAPDHVAAQGAAVRLRLGRQLQRLRMGQHRPAGARQPRRQHRGAACGGGGAGDPELRGGAAGAARPRRRPGRGAGTHRLALHDAADARKRGRRRARQDRARRAAADALGGAQEWHPARSP